ncbi:hypothetical protein JHK85_028114 [Glycine max]|nr:hypothetical protein JHK85_028114 [Glycine max]
MRQHEYARDYMFDHVKGVLGRVQGMKSRICFRSKEGCTNRCLRINLSKICPPNRKRCSGYGHGYIPDGFEKQGTSVKISIKQLLHERHVSNYRSTSNIREIDLIPSDVIYDLRCITKCMLSSGYLRECIQVYDSVQKSSVDASFRKLHIEKLSIGDIQRLKWEQLENKIRCWIKSAKVCIRTLFASEKKLCKQIFDGVETSIDDTCFMETMKGPVIQLFNFAKAISISHRLLEKLFKILDLHDTLTDLILDIDVVFDSKLSESIRIARESVWMDRNE